MPAQPFFTDGDPSVASPCGQGRITFPFEGDSHATTHQIAMLVPASNPTGFKYQLFAPQPDQTNFCEDAFILEQDFQMGKDFFTPLPMGTFYDPTSFWPDYTGSLDLFSLRLVSEGPQTDLTATQVRWTRTYAVVPPARNTYESFVFTFPGTAATKVGEVNTENESFLAAFGGLADGSKPITAEIVARVEHIYFHIGSGLDYTPNTTDYTQVDYIVPQFRVFYSNFYNEQPYVFDNTWSTIISWLDVSGTTVSPPALNTIPPLTNNDLNDSDSGAPYIGTGGMLGVAEICVKTSTIRPWRGNIYEKITIWALAQ